MFSRNEVPGGTGGWSYKRIGDEWWIDQHDGQGWRKVRAEDMPSAALTSPVKTNPERVMIEIQVVATNQYAPGGERSTRVVKHVDVDPPDMTAVQAAVTESLRRILSAVGERVQDSPDAVNPYGEPPPDLRLFT